MTVQSAELLHKEHLDIAEKTVNHARPPQGREVHAPAPRARRQWQPQYISAAGARNLLTYRYSGCDNSYMYRFVLSPLAEALVQFMPLWLAPNLLTCLGLLPSLFGHLLICHYSPNLEEPCPRWVWAVLCVCTLLYQTLDNMDGKQARRTGSSSPLGLLVDHGVDAFNVILQSINFVALLQVGDCVPKCLAVFWITAVPFYFATWEEYHTGSLHLGVFNGPSDGVLIVAAIQAFCAIHPDYTAVFRGKWVQSLSLGEAVILFYVLFVIVTVFFNLQSVYQRYRERPGLRRAVLHTLPFLALLVLSLLRPLLDVDGGALWASSPRLGFWFLGLCFLKLVVHLQLAHVCAEAYLQWRRTLLAPTALLVLDLLAGSGAARLWGVDSRCFAGCTAWLCLSCLHLAWGAVREVAAALNIHVFTLKAKVGKAA